MDDEISKELARRRKAHEAQEAKEATAQATAANAAAANMHAVLALTSQFLAWVSAKGVAPETLRVGHFRKMHGWELGEDSWSDGTHVYSQHYWLQPTGEWVQTLGGRAGKPGVDRIQSVQPAVIPVESIRRAIVSIAWSKGLSWP